MAGAGNIILNLAAGYVSSFNINTSTPDVPLSPPKELFPIVWTVLYILLGVVAGRLIKLQDYTLIFLYNVQLAINLLWTPIYFGLGLKELGAGMIVSMMLITGYIALRCESVRLLLLPYLTWLLFALYLNIATIVL